MSQLEASVQVNAPPSQVFAMVSDLRGAAERISGIKRLEVLTEGPVGKGTRFRETREMFGREATEEMEITEFTPGEGYVFECDSCGCHYRTQMLVAPEGAGTRLALSFQAQPLTLVSRVMAAVMMPLMRKKLSQLLHRDLEDIKAAIERDL